MHYPARGRVCAHLFAPVLALTVSCSGSIPDDTAETPGGPGAGGSAGPPGAGALGGGGNNTVPGRGGAGSGAGVGGAAGGSLSSNPGASGVALKGTPAFHRFVRLTHEQWEASVRDLLRLAAVPGLSAGFAGDPPNGSFTNNERALFVSSTLWGDYQRAAETLAAQITSDTQALSKLTGGSTDSAAFIRTFGRRTFRRPLTQAEEQRYQTLFAAGPSVVGSGNAFADGVRLVLESMLQSPKFVYRSELGNDGAPLGGFEMASKLSFLIRNTTPDDTLLDAAASGELDSAQGVLARATAMLETPAAKEAIGRYHAELFGLSRYGSIDKNRTKFPAYSEALNVEFERADRMFFDRVFMLGRGLREILTSPVAFVSTASAPLYGVKVSGSGLVETQLGPERPGFLTRLGYLAYNANLSEPDPIHRGVDILNRLMCLDLLPPANVDIPPVPAAQPGQTNRERVTAHTGDGTCGQGCHSTLINPVGFAFENFDALGQFRTTDNGKSIDTSGVVALKDGLKSFNGAPELATVLASAPSVHGCYVKHMTEFALARDTTTADRGLVDAIEGSSMNEDASIKTMLLQIIAHPSFLTRTGGAQ
ncbi:MAG TPA: DUF1592 domain-containing protein [Polyangiaceae bacterium]|nr:DUF1592 domain-containing protein [Polyangiaceae bacterium]